MLATLRSIHFHSYFSILNPFTSYWHGWQNPSIILYRMFKRPYTSRNQFPDVVAREERPEMFEPDFFLATTSVRPPTAPSSVITCRLYPEDPRKQFIVSSGSLIRVYSLVSCSYDFTLVHDCTLDVGAGIDALATIPNKECKPDNKKTESFCVLTGGNVLSILSYTAVDGLTCRVTIPLLPPALSSTAPPLPPHRPLFVDPLGNFIGVRCGPTSSHICLYNVASRTSGLIDLPTFGVTFVNDAILTANTTEDNNACLLVLSALPSSSKDCDRKACLVRFDANNLRPDHHRDPIGVEQGVGLLDVGFDSSNGVVVVGEDKLLVVQSNSQDARVSTNKNEVFILLPAQEVSRAGARSYNNSLNRHLSISGNGVARIISADESNQPIKTQEINMQRAIRDRSDTIVSGAATNWSSAKDGRSLVAVLLGRSSGQLELLQLSCEQRRYSMDLQLRLNLPGPVRSVQVVPGADKAPALLTSVGTTINAAADATSLSRGLTLERLDGLRCINKPLSRVFQLSGFPGTDLPKFFLVVQAPGLGEMQAYLCKKDGSVRQVVMADSLVGQCMGLMNENGNGNQEIITCFPTEGGNRITIIGAAGVLSLPNTEEDLIDAVETDLIGGSTVEHKFLQSIPCSAPSTILTSIGAAVVAVPGTTLNDTKLLKINAPQINEHNLAGRIIVNQIELSDFDLPDTLGQVTSITGLATAHRMSSVVVLGTSLGALIFIDTEPKADQPMVLAIIRRATAGCRVIGATLPDSSPSRYQVEPIVALHTLCTPKTNIPNIFISTPTTLLHYRMTSDPREPLYRVPLPPAAARPITPTDAVTVFGPDQPGVGVYLREDAHAHVGLISGVIIRHMHRGQPAKLATVLYFDVNKAYEMSTIPLYFSDSAGFGRLTVVPTSNINAPQIISTTSDDSNITVAKLDIFPPKSIASRELLADAEAANDKSKVSMAFTIQSTHYHARSGKLFVIVKPTSPEKANAKWSPTHYPCIAVVDPRAVNGDDLRGCIARALKTHVANLTENAEFTTYKPAQDDAVLDLFSLSNTVGVTTQVDRRYGEVVRDAAFVKVKDVFPSYYGWYSSAKLPDIPLDDETLYVRYRTANESTAVDELYMSKKHDLMKPTLIDETRELFVVGTQQMLYRGSGEAGRGRVFFIDVEEVTKDYYERERVVREQLIEYEKRRFMEHNKEYVEEHRDALPVLIPGFNIVPDDLKFETCTRMRIIGIYDRGESNIKMTQLIGPIMSVAPLGNVTAIGKGTNLVLLNIRNARYVEPVGVAYGGLGATALSSIGSFLIEADAAELCKVYILRQNAEKINRISLLGSYRLAPGFGVAADAVALNDKMLVVSVDSSRNLRALECHADYTGHMADRRHWLWLHSDQRLPGRVARGATARIFIGKNLEKGVWHGYDRLALMVGQLDGGITAVCPIERSVRDQLSCLIECTEAMIGTVTGVPSADACPLMRPTYSREQSVGGIISESALSAFLAAPLFVQEAAAAVAGVESRVKAVELVSSVQTMYLRAARR